ncbi:MAG: Crp/Fnr family transcriptional regulator [Zetaproteobacteria bacterium]|nr:MAG: Crp/Fnr family transcriptional regulator [Zetaproteobacteria bacterium]
MYKQDHHPVALEASIVADPLYARFCSLPVCKDLSFRDTMLLFSCFEPTVIEAGQTIYTAGSPSRHVMYLLLDGEVSVASASGDVYARLGAGEVFGLFSFLDDQRPHSASLRAEREVVALSLSRSYFDLITLEDPLLGGKLLLFMFRLLSRMALKLENEYAAIHEYALGRRV